MDERGEAGLLRYLLMAGPDAIQTWLSSVVPESQHAPAHFNWQALADACAANARTGLGLEWAAVAVRIYELLADESEATKESFLHSAMMLRAYLITRLGVRSGDPLLGPERIAAWFYDGLQTQPDEVVSIAKDLASYQIAKLRELRRIKNKLLVIKLLADAGDLRPDQEMQTWLSLAGELP